MTAHCSSGPGLAQEITGEIGVNSLVRLRGDQLYVACFKKNHFFQELFDLGEPRLKFQVRGGVVVKGVEDLPQPISYEVDGETRECNKVVMLALPGEHASRCFPVWQFTAVPT